MAIPVALYLIALAVRLVLILLYPYPGYPDSEYYVDVARAIHSGQGLNVDFVWIFAEVGGRIPAHPILPIPSNAHWMPLASFVQVPFLAVFGDSPLASDLPFALIGALVAPLTWLIAREAGARHDVALWAGILAAAPSMLLPFMAQPDNFGLYQPLAAATLWLTARGLKGDVRSYVLAGLTAGLATFARNDGVLLVVPIALAFGWSLRRARVGPAHARNRLTIPPWAPFAAAGLYLLAVGPWWIRQLATFGSLSPSTATGRVLYIRNIGEWDSIATPATLEHLLGQGLGPLLASRVLGLVAALGIFAILVCGVVLVPFVVVGIRGRLRSVDFGPFFAYAVTLFAASGLLFAVHVPGGTFIHSAVALAPHTYILALEGVAATVTWMASRRRGWDRERATGLFVPTIAAIVILAGALNVGSVQGAWADERARNLAVGAALDAAGADPADRVMSIDAAGTRYFTGHPGVVIVNDPLDVNREVATAYSVRWLVLERSNAVASMAPVLDGRRPSWIGPPVFVLKDPPTGRIELGLYPVCVQGDEQRCATLAFETEAQAVRRLYGP